MELPALHGNWVDFLIMVFILFYILEGWGRSFINAWFELVTFILSFVLAIKLYPLVATLLVDNFSFPKGVANAVGFFIIGLLVEQIISYLLIRIETKLPRSWQRNNLNNLLVVFPHVGNALVLLAFVLTLSLGLPIKGSIKTDVAESKIGSQIINQTQTLEKTLAGIFGQAISETFNFVTINPTSAQKVDLNFTQNQLQIDQESEKNMLTLINKERHQHQVRGLVMNQNLQQLARDYAQDMFVRGYFSHYNPEDQSPFDRMQVVGINYQVAGENLALAPSVVIAHQGLMASDGHRQNILSADFGKVGIGVIDGGIYGKMFVQEFTD